MYAFIILHYKNLKDTIECINSIKKLKEKNKKIVVIDNGTLKEEEKKALELNIDKLIDLKQNLGFAKANNTGCDYAKEKWQPDFLIVINNDTVINQKDFLKKISQIYKETNFDVLGPKILCPEGSGSVNPYTPLKTIEEVEKEMRYQQKLYKIYKHQALFLLLKLGIRCKRIFKKPKILKNETTRKTKVALHGCVLIFSKKYYQQFHNVFYNNTFLYHEESFLYLRIKNKNLISIYDPEIEIVHKEGASLDTSFNGNERKKLLFRKRLFPRRSSRS